MRGVYVYTRMYIYLCGVRTHTHAYTYIYVGEYANTRIYIYLCGAQRKRKVISVRQVLDTMCVRTYTYTHTNTHTHTHTYTHAHSLTHSHMHARTHARTHKDKRASIDWTWASLSDCVVTHLFRFSVLFLIRLFFVCVCAFVTRTRSRIDLQLRSL